MPWNATKAWRTRFERSTPTVRWEERTLFNEIQERLSDEALAELRGPLSAATVL